MSVTVHPKGNKPSAPKAYKLPAKKTPTPTTGTAPWQEVGELPEDKPVQLIAKTPVAKITKEYKDGTVIEDEVKFPSQNFEGPPATVGLSMGCTRNLGNYESVKYTVHLTLPCEPTPEALEIAFNEVHGWVDMRVELINQEINDQLNS